MPNTGNIFSGWSGACSGNGSCNFTMNGATSVSATFTVATTPPDTTISAVPPTLTFSTYMGAFRFTSTTAGTFECSLNGEPFYACSSPIMEGPTYPGRVPIGNNTFSVRAKDTAGNLDPTPAIYNWQICNIMSGALCYNTLPDAYAVTMGEILLRAEHLYDSLTMNRPVVTTLKGGFTSDQNNSGGEYTTIHGDLTIVDGSVTVENLSIQ